MKTPPPHKHPATEPTKTVAGRRGGKASSPSGPPSVGGPYSGNMILRVSANDARFKTVSFHAGMNLILADKTDKSIDTDSRNGVGKTLLIDIIHFLLGGKLEGKALKSDELSNHVFEMEIRLGGNGFTVRRAVGDEKTVFLDAGDFSGWPEKPIFEKKTNCHQMKVGEWCRVLGYHLFGLADGISGGDAEVSFRSIFPFLVRRTRDQGYADPFKAHGQMKEGQKQLCNAFLLGLSVEYAARFENLREKGKHLDAVQRAVKSGLLREVTGSIGKLESDVAVLEQEIEEGTQALASFKVIPEYAKVEKEANAITQEMHSLEKEVLTTKNLLHFYRKCVTEEKDPGRTEVAGLFEEAGVVFPDQVKRRLDDVEEFHKQLVQNRREFLRQEMDRLDRQEKMLTERIARLDSRRSELLEILGKGGALQEYNALQEEHTKRLGRLEQTRADLSKLKQLKEGRNALKIEEATLNQSARRDLEERHAIRKRALTAFEQFSRELYGESGGRLIIDLKDKSGYLFGTQMPRSDSEGIEAMKVFCYDLTLASIWSRKTPSPGFLIHDSTIFDPCDARQVASALRLAARQAEVEGYQYICMLNSDRVPRQELGSFNIDQYIRLILTDQPKGCLLGFRLKQT